ncbi:MAG: hypothetical protein QW175_04635, partial [Candidatus Bathyarchaeia archaeon]
FNMLLNIGNIMSISKLQIAGKGTLFGTAISIITAGTNLIKDNFQAGVICLAAGVALIILWALLIDYEARSEAQKTALKLFEKFKREMEGTKRGRKEDTD